LTYNKLVSLGAINEYDKDYALGQGLSGGWVDDYNKQTEAANNDFYGNRGIASEALKASAPESFFQNLGRVLSNSERAQGITEQGVASDAIRNNYNMIQRLMGQGSDQLKFRDTDERYKEGQFILDPNKIRGTF